MSSNEKDKANISNEYENLKKNKILNSEEKILDEFDDVIDCSKHSDTHCGWGCGYRAGLQRFATQSAFVLNFGLIGLVMSMTYAYFNGTITTLEKRFHLSSRSIGITQIGGDLAQTITSLFFIHYVSKRHRPRWVGIGAFIICLYCVLITLPHWIYGAGEDALKLTVEYGGSTDENVTKALNLAEDTKTLCYLNTTIDDCATKINSPQEAHPMLIFFSAQLFSGLGWSLFYTLGYAYMDDNVEKSKMATMYSFSSFLHMLGPSCGYTIAAFSLRHYVTPNLTPVIDNQNPHWIGAWWMGWLIFAGLLFVCAFFLSMFPKELPSKYKRNLRLKRLQTESLLKKEKKLDVNSTSNGEIANMESSTTDLLETLKRIVKNKIYMCNNIASIFFCFGYMPYWIFTPKYLEIVFRQSAAASNVYTGTVALVFTAIGTLASGMIISRKKPRARVLASYNALIGLLTVAGFFSYSFIGCPGNENSLFLEQPSTAVGPPSFGCAETCHCEFVPYTPVCGANNLTYISPCHAGCKSIRFTESGEKFFDDCECVRPLEFDNATLSYHVLKQSNTSYGISQEPFLERTAVPGSCTANCFKNFIGFLILMCGLKFIGSTTKASYFLIQMRCVAVKDKTVSLGFGMVMLSLLSFIPSPIFFGWILDRMCLVWGKTCTEKSNCWLYDARRLRYTLNYTASIFLVMGALCDCVNCYLVKDLKIYDDEEKAEEEKIASNMELAKLSGSITKM